MTKQKTRWTCTNCIAITLICGKIAVTASALCPHCQDPWKEGQIEVVPSSQQLDAHPWRETATNRGCFRNAPQRQPPVSAILLVFFIIAKLLGFRLDDIQDDSILRRSVPTAHSIYGVSRTVNSANYAAFVTFEKVLDIGDPKVRRNLCARRT